MITINYDEPDTSTYNGVSVFADGKTQKTFNTNNPTFDFACACLYAENQSNEYPVMCSSSVDHFIMDGGELDTDPTIALYEKALEYLEKVTK